MIENYAHVVSETDKAIEYLKDSEAEHASLRAELSSLQELRKTVKAYSFLDAEGNIEQRNSTAYASTEYRNHIALIKETEEKYHFVQNKRQRAIAMVSLYQTISANTRKGNVI